MATFLVTSGRANKAVKGLERLQPCVGLTRIFNDRLDRNSSWNLTIPAEFWGIFKRTKNFGGPRGQKLLMICRDRESLTKICRDLKIIRFQLHFREDVFNPLVKLGKQVSTWKWRWNLIILRSVTGCNAGTLVVEFFKYVSQFTSPPLALAWPSAPPENFLFLHTQF